MPDSLSLGGRKLCRLLIGATALCGFPLAALADDVAPTPEGAQKLRDVLALYLGQKATGAIDVTPQGDHYVVSVDPAKVAAAFAIQDLRIEATPYQFNLTERGDGSWRFVWEGAQTAKVHFKTTDLSSNIDGVKSEGIYDPAIAGFTSYELKVEKRSFELHSPQFDEIVSAGPAHATGIGKAGAAGGFTGSVHQEAADSAFTVTPKTADATQASPPPIAFRFAGVSADVDVSDMRTQAILDLWRYFVAHPSRAEMASDEDGLKSRLRALIPLADKFDERVSMQSLVVDTPKGEVKMDAAKMGFNAAKFPSNGDIEIRLAVGGLALPSGLLPPGLSDLVPTSVDLDMKYSGYDYAAAAEEAINDLHLAGEGPVFAEADGPKIAAKMMGGGPIMITIVSSHVTAPQVDLSLDGSVQLVQGKPIGKVTLKAKNFDQTIAAIKAAGPQIATPQALGGLTMAKGLGKADADGALTWALEYGADGAIKVNGLALGKAPTK